MGGTVLETGDLVSRTENHGFVCPHLSCVAYREDRERGDAASCAVMASSVL